MLAARLVHEVTEAPVGRIADALRALLRSLGSQLGLDRSALYMLTRDRRRLQVVAAWQGANVPEPSVAELRAATSVFVQRIIRGEVVSMERVEDGLASVSAVDVDALRTLRLKSSLVLPLRVGGGTVGAHALATVHRHVTWPPRFLQDLSVVSDALALAVDRMRGEELRELELRENDLVQHMAGIGHWRHNVALQTTVGSRELHRMLQLDPRRDLTPELIAERIVPQDRDRFRAHVFALTLGEEVPALELRVRLGDGEERWCLCWGCPSEHQPAGPQLIYGIMHDITERKQAEQALDAAHGRLVQAQEDERMRLGHELHDELGQRLAALDLRLVSMSNDLQEKAPVQAASLHEAIEQVQELAYIARSVSHALYPAELQRLGLARSVQSLCQRSAASETTDVEIELGHVPDGLPEATALALYRVGQESLSNALRHADARNITVFLGVVDDRLRLVVTDDGEGFATDEPTIARGLGLSGMEERMRLVHGTFSIESSPGTGTRMCAEVPVVVPKEPT